MDVYIFLTKYVDEKSNNRVDTPQNKESMNAQASPISMWM